MKITRRKTIPCGQAVLRIACGLTASMIAPCGVHAETVATPEGLEEIVVTSRKSEENLQNVPLAVSVLSAKDLLDKGISNIGDFISAPTPFLRVIPYAGATSLPLIGIRGLSTDDPGQASNEPAVGIYVDGIYLSRSQGSLMDLAEIDHMEILRGPQGTLFGRNALGGAVSVVTKKPTGRFGIDQTVELGNYKARKSTTHLNLPALAGIKTKIDYSYSQRGGTINNLAAEQWDFSEYDRWATRFGALWDAVSGLTVEYSYDKSKDNSAFGYNQRTTQGTQGGIPGFGIPALTPPLPPEPNRVDTSASPEPLRPTLTETQGHALTVAWNVSDALTLKSISSYREVKYRSFEDYPNFFFNLPLGAALGASGFLVHQNDDQSQYSQELQTLGAMRTEHLGQFKYLAGLYDFQEKVHDTSDSGTKLFNYPNGSGNPASATLVNPFITFGELFGGAYALNWDDDLKATSRAVYAQTSWSPPGIEDRVEVTVGLRYTKDSKDGRQTFANGLPSTLGFDLNSSRTDRNVTIKYAFSDSVSIYARDATGYRAGGVSLRDPQFVPFKPDTSESRELGLKSEFWDRRARVNLAIYNTEVANMRTSFSDPASPTTTRLFNATGKVKIDGVEAEATLVAMKGLTLNASYAYTSTRYPQQSNPFAPAILQSFVLAQAPKHSGSVSVDWELAHLSVGNLDFHGDGYWTTKYVSVPQLVDSGNSYSLFNARLALRDIKLGKAAGTFRASLWIKNLTDKQYPIFEVRWGGGVPLTDADSRIVQFGEPRTYGIALNYNY
jgi:iron complex outermembrane recepter protein